MSSGSCAVFSQGNSSATVEKINRFSVHLLTCIEFLLDIDSNEGTIYPGVVSALNAGELINSKDMSHNKGHAPRVASIVEP